MRFRDTVSFDEIEVDRWPP